MPHIVSRIQFITKEKKKEIKRPFILHLRQMKTTYHLMGIKEKSYKKFSVYIADIFALVFLFSIVIISNVIKKYSQNNYFSKDFTKDFYACFRVKQKT